MKKILYNTTTHKLTDEQVKDFDEVRELKEENPRLFEALSNTPGDEAQLRELAAKLLAELMYEKVRLGQVGTVKFLFPIGSPAFQTAFWALATSINSDIVDDIIFSHTKRVVEEEAGVKRSVFRHERFIEAKKLI